MRKTVGHHLRRPLLAAILLCGAAFGQSSLRLKTHSIATDPAQVVSEAEGSGPAGNGHLLMQFGRPPSAARVAELSARGVTVLADVPDNGLLVSVAGPVALTGLGVRYAAPIAAADKISPLAASNATGFLLVEFYPDVDLGDARSLVLSMGAPLSDNPDLGPHVLMIQTSDMNMVQSLAQLDAVSYIFPASTELAQGIPVSPCVGALTTNGTTVQSIPTYGDGWDGPGLGSATVYYYYSNVTSQLNAASAKAAIAQAMAQWSNVVKVNWAPGASATAPQTVNILWATYAHGDAYPFDGPGGILAHTFYPAPPNPEPIAGDMHLDDSESWHIGANTDLFSVTLHELGHALGLGHSDNPNDVMYPYYKMVSGLAAGDIAAIQTLYAAQSSAAPAPAPSALTLTVNPPAATTTASAVSLTGSAQGGSGTITVTWSDATASGTALGTAAAWTISNIPLAMGANTITVVASAGSSRVSQTVTITRQASSSPTSNPGTGTDTTPPTLTITSPGATSVSTTAAVMTFNGVASDNTGVTQVTWATNTGASGVAGGTSAWSCAIPLLVGSNVVTIKAFDAAGNSSWRSVVVTRN